MFFRKKKRINEQSDVDTSLSMQSCEQSNNIDENIFEIEDLINACEYYAGTDDEATVVKLLADCLYNGSNGIERNYDMSYDYYFRLSNLDKPTGICGMGKVDIAIGLDTGEKYRFSKGIHEVYQAYVLGDNDAKIILEVTSKSGMFENISTFDEMIRFCESCNNNN